MGDRLFYFVFSNPMEGRDDEFNEWYDTVHIPEVLAVPGMISAQRTELKETEVGKVSGKSPDFHRYCVVYEMDGDPDEIMGIIRAQVASGEMHMLDCIDTASVQMSWWTQQGQKQLAPGR